MPITSQIGSSSLIKPGVVDSAATRPASPYEGQVIFQKDTDQLLVWNGTAWVIPNQTTQNPEGLEFISTATFTAQTTGVSLPTNTFTSTYKSYRILFGVHTQSDAGSVSYTLKMRLNGTDDSSTRWYGMSTGIDSGGGVYNKTGNDATSIGLIDSYSSGFAQTLIAIDVHYPFLVERTHVAGHAQQATKGITINAQYNAKTSFDSLSFLISAGSITGYYSVYGYRNS
jgi:hypothetical protein